MEFLEKDLEEIIYNADKDLLAKKGLYINGILKRQLRIGNYGVADLVTFKREYDERYYSTRRFIPVLRVTVYELKKENINISAFLQALCYVKGIDRFFEKRNFNFPVIFNIVLIGKQIDKNSSFIYLTDYLFNRDMSDFLDLYTFKYNIDGIQFKIESDYKLTDEGF